ncbi:hypothetical protein D3C78_528320 [compost metagenome]
MPGAEGANRLRVSQHRVVRDGRRTTEIHHVRIMEVVKITAFYRHNRLVEGKPVQHAIAKQLKANLCVAGIRSHDVTVFPAAHLLHRHRHIEVEQGDERRNALFKQLVEHLIVEVYRLRIHFTDTVWNQTRPANRGAKAVMVQLLQQLNVRFPVLAER